MEAIVRQNKRVELRNFIYYIFNESESAKFFLLDYLTRMTNNTEHSSSRQAPQQT